MSLPAAVGPYLDELSRQLVATLGSDLLGAYVTGSVAMNDFSPATSDIDVVAVCRDHVSREARAQLAERIRPRRLPCPARGLEFVLYPHATIVQNGTAPGFVLEINEGTGMTSHVAFDAADRDSSEGDFWYVIDRSIVRSVGRALVGPPAGELFPAEDPAAILEALRDSLHWHAGRAPDRNALLNGCRALRWARERIWSSKNAAGRWYLEIEDEPVVCDALDGREIAARPAQELLRRLEQGVAAAQA